MRQKPAPNNFADLTDSKKSDVPMKIDNEFATATPLQTTRSSRYLDNIIHLDDEAVQLRIISGNSEDNADNNGNYQDGGKLIATGDIDNDGKEDLILGSPYANGIAESEETAGQVMVIFGRDQTYPGTTYDQAQKNTDEVNLVIHGVDGNSLFNSGDMLGHSVALGDIDGDGFDDIVIGAPFGDSYNNQRRNAGEVYVIYGDSRANLGTEINLASTMPDLMVFGAYTELFNNPDLTGFSVAVGDVIGDSKEDIIIGAPGANVDSRTDAGIIWVISGKPRSTQGSSIDLQAGTDLMITGTVAGGVAGFEVEAGDVNDDGREDILIGAIYAEKDSSRTNAGITYVVYGRQTFPSAVSLRGGADAIIYGSNTNDYSGWSLAVGNLNGDSYNDIIIGTPAGDGPNNNQDNAGEVYVIYGSSSIPSEIDLNSNEQDIIIYGENPQDNFGYSVSMGIVNNDQYHDLLISSRNGDGQQNGKSNCGETYLILGNSTANLGNNIDALSDSRSIFYGVDVDDQSGRSVHLGDFDSDGFDDVIIAAPRADGDGGRNYAGEYYLIFSQPPHTINRFLELVDGDIDSQTILAKYKAYTFRINATNILGYKDFKSITLTLDPLGYNIAYSWVRTDNQFHKINDPLGLVECISTSSNVKSDNNYNYSIEFKLIFDWTFNKTYPIDCKITTLGARSLIDEDYYPDLFRVNNKLGFKGKLVVIGSIQGKLKDKAWVQGDEELSFTGITIVYSGTTDFYPPVSEYSLGIEDNSNLTRFTDLELGEEINATVHTPTLTIDYDYRLKILDIPDYCDNSSLSISLQVDSDPPNPPAPVLCKADSILEIGFAEVDDDTELFLSWDTALDKGSGIKGYYYGFEDNSGTSNGLWTADTDAKITNATEGLNTIHVWAEDMVGNIGQSMSSQIFIDLTDVTFANFTPLGHFWLTTKNVNCTIQVLDLNGFGANPENVWYWDNINEKWEKATDISFLSKSILNVTLRAKFVEGTKNYIKFRATDLAGNGPAESETYYLKIDTIPVTFKDIKPDPVNKQANSILKCSVTIEDLGGSGVNLSTIQYSYTTSGLGNFTAWDDSGLARIIGPNSAEESSTWFVDLQFKRGSENYIRWRAKDMAGNGWTVSDNYKINVNAKPTIIIDEIEPGTKFYSNKKIELNADKTYDVDNNPNELEFTWRSNITGEIGKGEKLSAKLLSGKHKITLTVYDGINYANSSINITVKTPKDDSKAGLFGLGANVEYLIILIIIIIIISCVFFVLYNLEKKRRRLLEEKEKQLALGPEISYVPGRAQPRFGFGSTTGYGTPLGVRSSNGQFPPSMHPSQYSSGVAGGDGTVQQLPGIGGTFSATSQAQVSSTQPFIGTTPGSGVGVGVGMGGVSGVSGVNGVVGRPIPQLPPVQPGAIESRIESDFERLHPSRKLDLLEKKMLTGEIPVDLYQRLSNKYEQELQMLQTRPATAATQVQVHLPSVQPQPVTKPPLGQPPTVSTSPTTQVVPAQMPTPTQIPTPIPQPKPQTIAPAQPIPTTQRQPIPTSQAATQQPISDQIKKRKNEEME